MVDRALLRRSESETEEYLGSHGHPDTAVSLAPAGRGKVRVTLRDVRSESAPMTFEVDAGSHPNPHSLSRKVAAKVPKLLALRCGRVSV